MSNAPAPVPSGYTKRSDQLVGFWKPDAGPIEFIPREVRLLDNHANPRQTSCLVIGDLLAPTVLVSADGGEVRGLKGDKAGVWYKPGLKIVLDCAGIPTFICETGELDTGKPSPMKTYEVATKEPHRRRLPLGGDYRKRSRNSPDPTGLTQEAPSLPDNKLSDDNIPF